MPASTAQPPERFIGGSSSRTMMYNIEQGLQHLFESQSVDPTERMLMLGRHMQAPPHGFGTEFQSRFDMCNKAGRLPEGRRVVLWLLDVRGNLDQVGASTRWKPTEHMTVGGLVHNMPTPMIRQKVRDMSYDPTCNADIQ